MHVFGGALWGGSETTIASTLSIYEKQEDNLVYDDSVVGLTLRSLV